MKCCLAAIYVFSCILVAAQQRIVNVDKDGGSPLQGFFYTVAGTPVSTAKYIRVVDGSPFFRDGWMKGSALMADGSYYGYYPMRLDLLANDVYFQNEAGKEFVATKPIAELFLADSITGLEFHFVHSSAFVSAKAPEAGWYLLLVDGAASLFKKIHKHSRESRPYASATYEQTIITSSVYYVFYATAFLRVKKISDIPGVLQAKNQQLRQYINKNRLAGKTDADYVRLIEYFNSISETN
jgi:hypothetical protein